MIRVNLLPPDRRRPEKTPLPSFLLVLVAAALATGVLVILAFIGVNIMNVGKDIKDHDQQIAGLQGAVDEWKQLNEEVGAAEKREKTIKDLSKRPVVWSEVLDHVWSILDAEKSLFITDLRMLDEAQARGYALGPGGRPLPRGQSPEYGLLMEVRIFGHDTTRMTNLRAAFAGKKEIHDVLPLMNAKPTILYKIDSTDGPQMEFTLVLLAKAGPKTP